MIPQLSAIKIGAVIVAVLAIMYVGWLVNGWRQDSHDKAAAEAARDAAVREAAQIAESLTEQIRASQEASEGYQNELATLRANRVPRVVRLCSDPAAGVPAPGSTPGGSDGPAPGPGSVPPSPGRDIGSGLYGVADTADELAARLRALQEWVKATR